jgi:hypothetical protein
MALKVGIYDEPQVKSQQAPSAGLSVSVPNFGAALGQGLQDVASAADQEVQRLNRKRLEDFDTNLTKFDLAQRAQILSVKGYDAFAPYQDGTTKQEKWQQDRTNYTQELLKDLTPQQAAAAEQMAKKSGVQAQATWAIHQDRELQDWTHGVALNGVKVNSEDALANYSNPTLFKAALDKVDYYIHEAHPGMDVSAQLADQRSVVALEALRSMVSNNVVVDPANSEHLTSLLTPTDKLKADVLMKHGNAANLAIQAGIDYLPAVPTAENVQTIADHLYSTEGTPYYHNAGAHKEFLSLGHQKVLAGKNTTDQFDKDKIGDLTYRIAMGQLGTSGARSELAALTGQMSKEAQGHAAVWLDNWDKRNKELASERYPDAVRLILSEGFSAMTKDEMIASLDNFPKQAPMIVSMWEKAQADGGKFAIPPVVKDSVITTLEKVDGFNRKDETAKGQLNDAILQATEDLRKKGKGIYATRPPTQEEMKAAVLLRARKRDTSEGFMGMFKAKESLSKMTPDQEKAAIKALAPQDKKLIDTWLNERGVKDRSTRTILSAKDTVDSLRVGDKSGYVELWNLAFPASTTPVDPTTAEGM